MASPSADAFTVGIVYIKPLELMAITPMLDERFLSIPVAHGDHNDYILGRIGDHNVVIVGPARGDQGTVATAQFITTVHLTFPNLTMGMLVGIGGGVPHYPEHDVRLGDVVVGAPETGPAVVQYDLGKRTADGTETTRSLAKPPPSLLRVINKVEDKYMCRQDKEDDPLQPHLDRFSRYPRLRQQYCRPVAPDRLFQAEYLHEAGTRCSEHSHQFEQVREPRDPDEVAIHYSTILSGNLVMKSSKDRDLLSRKYNNALCFEMEAAGLMDVFPCLVIRGICDYSDSHKNDAWQKYAASTAAAYAREVLLNMSRRTPKMLGSSSKLSADLQLEGLPLGTPPRMPKDFVVRTVPRETPLLASRLTTSSSHHGSDGGVDNGGGGEESQTSVVHLTRIGENEDGGADARPGIWYRGAPQWHDLGWFNETLSVEGFCLDVKQHSVHVYSQNAKVGRVDTIKPTIIHLTIYKHSHSFAEGSTRTAYYARTAASTNQFVVKSFKKCRLGFERSAHIFEKIRIQILSKAFALEFNYLVKRIMRAKFWLDFIVTTDFQVSGWASGYNCISLEPFIEGDYIKYNSNAGYVKKDESPDSFNAAAQAFSHFTFERSRGAFLVVDLQGVRCNLIDPTIHTKDLELFTLTLTNLNLDGFKSFFASHVCNSVCRGLGLKSNKGMFLSDNWEFRAEWPIAYKTVYYCSNRLCRKIIHQTMAQISVKFPGYRWCTTCWPQLESATVEWHCDEPGADHVFDVSLFFYESQGQVPPRKCPKHC